MSDETIQGEVVILSFPCNLLWIFQDDILNLKLLHLKTAEYKLDPSEQNIFLCANILEKKTLNFILICRYSLNLHISTYNRYY